MYTFWAATLGTTIQQPPPDGMQQLQVVVETLTWMQQSITVEQHSLQRTVATVTTGKGGGNSDDSEVLQRTVALEDEIRQLKVAVETLRAPHIDLQQAFQQHPLSVTPSANPRRL